MHDRHILLSGYHYSFYRAEQMSTPVSYTHLITLPPIGLDTQIQDAIEGENEETKLAVQDLSLIHI